MRLRDRARSMVKGDDYGDSKTAIFQALQQAFADGAGRLVIRLAGGVPPSWQPPELFPKRKTTPDNTWDD